MKLNNYDIYAYIFMHLETVINRYYYNATCAPFPACKKMRETIWHRILKNIIFKKISDTLFFTLLTKHLLFNKMLKHHICGNPKWRYSTLYKKMSHKTISLFEVVSFVGNMIFYSTVCKLLKHQKTIYTYV